MGSGEVTVSHQQFANDMMIYCDADVKQIRYLRCIKVVSGLKINLVKNESFQVGDDCDIQNLAWILGCKIGTLLPSYLGLSLGASYQSNLGKSLVCQKEVN